MSKYFVNTTALTLRGGADKKAYVVGYLKQNDVVDGLAISADGHWRKVRTSGGQVGWCSNQYLSPLSATISTAPATPSLPAEGSYSVSSFLLFMRQNPGTSFRVIGFLRRGDVVAALGKSTDFIWLKVRNKNGLTGWCSNKFLTRVGETAPVPVNTTEAGMYMVTVDKSRLYQKSSGESTLIGEMLAKSIVNVSAFSTDHQWAKISTNMGYAGWCLAENLVSLGNMTNLQPQEEFPWMPIAFAEIGMREYPGNENNPRVQEYLASTSLGKGYPDETHWCAAFVNWCVKKTGIASNNSPMAYSWSNWGQPLEPPRRGCIVTFKWDDGGSHVAFYLGERGQKVLALGGNQADGVWIMAYPKKNVSAYRIPKNWTAPV